MSKSQKLCLRVYDRIYVPSSVETMDILCPTVLPRPISLCLLGHHHQFPQRLWNNHSGVYCLLQLSVQCLRLLTDQLQLFNSPIPTNLCIDTKLRLTSAACFSFDDNTASPHSICLLRLFVPVSRLAIFSLSIDQNSSIHQPIQGAHKQDIPHQSVINI